MNKKWIIVICCVVLAAVGAGVAVAIVNNSASEEEEIEAWETEQEAKDEEVDETEETAAEEEKVAEIEAQGQKQKVAQYDGGDPNESADLTGVVTYVGVNGGNLMIRTSIDQFLNEGQCELNIYQGGSVVYSEVANIIGNVSTATCEGFDIATQKLPNGKLSIKINLSSGGKTGIIEGEANI